MRAWLATWLRRWADWLAPLPAGAPPMTLPAPAVSVTFLPRVGEPASPSGPTFTVVQDGVAAPLYVGSDGATAAAVFLAVKHGSSGAAVQLLHDGIVRDRYDGTATSPPSMETVL